MRADHHAQELNPRRDAASNAAVEFDSSPTDFSIGRSGGVGSRHRNMMISEWKKLIFEFIRKYPIAVMATISPEAKSEAATMSFGITDDFEIIFQTFTSYRKYRNLRSNPSVAFVFGWDKKVTIQYEGIACELPDQDSVQYRKIYFEQNPTTVKWDEVPGAAWFKVSPKWIRYLDNTEPRTIHEITFPNQDRS